MTDIFRYANINQTSKMGEWDCLKYISEELRQEYSRIASDCPDVPQLNNSYINVSDVLRAYFILADYFTDSSVKDIEPESMLVGLRSYELLVSALSRQNVSFGGKTKYSDKLDICATLFFGLVKNHAFLDGNKRTALLILLYQLHMNGYMPCVSVTDYEKLVVAVASNTVSAKYSHVYKKFKKKNEDAIIYTISYLLKRMTKRKDHTYSIEPTMKQFCMAIAKYDVKYSLKNDKVHFERVIPHWISPKKKTYAIQFGGWTRCVFAGTAREALTTLKIYDQIPSYQEFIDGCDPMYNLISKFEVPFRRLKDE